MTQNYYSTKRTTCWPVPRDGVYGMCVRYEDGYTSWCPLNVFERDYQPVSEMNFGHALAAMAAGDKVTRGDNTWWVCQATGNKALAAASFWNKHTRAFAEESAEQTAEVAPYFLFKTADDKIVMGWQPSQTDMLATDWRIVS